MEPGFEQPGRRVLQADGSLGQHAGGDQPQVKQRHAARNGGGQREVEHPETLHSQVVGDADHQQVRGRADGRCHAAHQGGETHGKENAGGRR